MCITKVRINIRNGEVSLSNEFDQTNIDLEVRDYDTAKVIGDGNARILNKDDKGELYYKYYPI